MSQDNLPATSITPRKPPGCIFRSQPRNPLNITHYVNTDFGFHNERLQDVGWSRQKDTPRQHEELEQDIQTTAVKHIHTLQTPAVRGSKATEKVHNLYTMLDSGTSPKHKKERPQKLNINPVLLKQYPGSTSNLSSETLWSNGNSLSTGMKSRSLVKSGTTSLANVPRGEGTIQHQ